LLWIAPFMIGVKSRAYQGLRRHLLTPWLDEGFRALDPRSDQAVNYVTTALERLLRAYPVDGFKVDYDYGLLAPGQDMPGVGQAYADAVRRMVEALRRIAPRIEWNLLANAFSRRVTPAFRCVDVPFDPESNRLIMANAAAITSGAALYSDPCLWSARDSLTTVHRHLVPALFIVPSVGAPLLDLPPEHTRALRDWLRFYRRHQPLLNRGAFRAEWRAGDFQSFARTRGAQRIVAAFSEYPVTLSGARKTRLIHAGTAGALTVDCRRTCMATREDADGRIRSSTQRLPKGLHRLSGPPGAVWRIES
jgi:hypothetical protein